MKGAAICSKKTQKNKSINIFLLSCILSAAIHIAVCFNFLTPKKLTEVREYQIRILATGTPISIVQKKPHQHLKTDEQIKLHSNVKNDFSKIALRKPALSPLDPVLPSREVAMSPRELTMSPRGLTMSPRGLTAGPSQMPQDNSAILKIIGNLALPQSILEQNLFPRKYLAVFELHRLDKTEINLKFIQLKAVSDPLEYLDKIVSQAFVKKLNSIDLTQLKMLLIKIDTNQNTNYKRVSSLANNVNRVELILEFHEPNK